MSQQRTLLAVFLTLVSLASVSLGSTIAVIDPGFETPGTINSGSTSWASIDAVWNPTGNNLYEQNNGDNVTAQNGLGNYAAYLANASSIQQDLLTTVSPGETVSVTFYGGKTNYGGAPGGGTFTGTFLAGATSYSASFDTSGLSTPGSNFTAWQSYTLTEHIVNSGDLQLRFANGVGNAWLDTISSVTIIPCARAEFNRPRWIERGCLVGRRWSTQAHLSPPPLSYAQATQDASAPCRADYRRAGERTNRGGFR
jgi:hypothetical protein